MSESKKWYEIIFNDGVKVVIHFIDTILTDKIINRVEKKGMNRYASK